MRIVLVSLCTESWAEREQTRVSSREAGLSCWLQHTPRIRFRSKTTVDLLGRLTMRHRAVCSVIDDQTRQPLQVACPGRLTSVEPSEWVTLGQDRGE